MDIQSLFDKEFFEDIRKDVTYEFGMIVKTVGEQLSSGRKTRSSYDQRNHFFTTKFYDQANALGLTESDAIDVYTNGQEIQEGIMQRAYNGYELGIEYQLDVYSGKPVIHAIWKREV